MLTQQDKICDQRALQVLPGVPEPRQTFSCVGREWTIAPATLAHQARPTATPPFGKLDLVQQPLPLHSVLFTSHSNNEKQETLLSQHYNSVEAVDVGSFRSREGAQQG